MWWFLNKAHERTPRDAISPRVKAISELEPAVDQLKALLNDDVAFKFWLPEIIALTIRDQAGREGVSQSALLRDLLAEYVYGRLAAQTLRRLREERSQGANLFFTIAEPEERGPGRWIYKVPELGKSTVAFKLWMSSKQKDDMQALAEHAGVTQSALAREVIISAWLGHASLPERAALFQMASAHALAWERDEEVPLLNLTKQEFMQRGGAVEGFDSDWEVVEEDQASDR